jgi:hemolysin expression modulating protein
MDFRLRRCTSQETLERDNKKNKYSLTDDERALHAAVDHGWRKWQWGSFMIKYLGVWKYVK